MKHDKPNKEMTEKIIKNIYNNSIKYEDNIKEMNKRVKETIDNFILNLPSIEDEYEIKVENGDEPNSIQAIITLTGDLALYTMANNLGITKYMMKFIVDLYNNSVILKGEVTKDNIELNTVSLEDFAKEFVEKIKKGNVIFEPDNNGV